MLSIVKIILSFIDNFITQFDNMTLRFVIGFAYPFITSGFCSI